jgi:hypothetical protein
MVPHTDANQQEVSGQIFSQGAIYLEVNRDYQVLLEHSNKRGTSNSTQATMGLFGRALEPTSRASRVGALPNGCFTLGFDSRAPEITLSRC